MKFLGDVAIAQLTIDHLRRQGHNAIRVVDRLPPTASDAEIVRLATTEGRVILCFDLDFGALVALAGGRSPSVVTFRTTKQRPTYINRRLDAILEDIEEDLLRGALATVEDHRVRVRSLPVRSTRGRS